MGTFVLGRRVTRLCLRVWAAHCPLTYLLLALRGQRYPREGSRPPWAPALQPPQVRPRSVLPFLAEARSPVLLTRSKSAPTKRTQHNVSPLDDAAVTCSQAGDLAGRVPGACSQHSRPGQRRARQTPMLQTSVVPTDSSSRKAPEYASPGMSPHGWG